MDGSEEIGRERFTSKPFSREYARERFLYDPLTGMITWNPIAILKYRDIG